MMGLKRHDNILGQTNWSSLCEFFYRKRGRDKLLCIKIEENDSNYTMRHNFMGWPTFVRYYKIKAWA